MAASVRGPSSSSTGPLSTTSAEIEGAHDGREGDAETLAGTTQDLVALGWASGAHASFAVEPGDGEPGLEAAELAAGAGVAAVGPDDDVADLAGGEAAAEERGAAEQQAGADTVADLDEHHVAERVAEAVLGERGGVRVVGDEHRVGRSRPRASPAAARRSSRGWGR